MAYIKCTKIINIILRTFNIKNLKISLFDIPVKISYTNVEIYIHNDNPHKQNEFFDIVNEFKLQYPQYTIHIIQETINQHMFMSYLNSLSYLNKNNTWTMILDDDDTLCGLSEDFFNFLDNLSENQCVQYQVYKAILIANSVQKLRCDRFGHAIKNWYPWHRIYHTSKLLEMSQKRDFIIDTILKFQDTTKISYGEDYLFYHLMKYFFNLEDVRYTKHPIINYSCYYHEVNGYKSITTYTQGIVGENLTHKILDYLKR